MVMELKTGFTKSIEHGSIKEARCQFPHMNCAVLSTFARGGV